MKKNNEFVFEISTPMFVTEEVQNLKNSKPKWPIEVDERDKFAIHRG